MWGAKTRFVPWIAAANLLAHPKEDGHHNLAALVIDRVRLGAVHASKFNAAELCPPTN